LGRKVPLEPHVDPASPKSGRVVWLVAVKCAVDVSRSQYSSIKTSPPW
jgi:hypothetical protein